MCAVKEAVKGGVKKGKVEGTRQSRGRGREGDFIASAQSGEALAGAGQMPPNPVGKAATLR